MPGASVQESGGHAANLPAAITALSVETPALIIVGEVVGLRERLAWFDPQSAATGGEAKRLSA